MPLSPRSILVRFALSATLALAAIGFLGEVRARAGACGAPPPPDTPVLAWRWGTPPVERLRRFLDAADWVVPHGAVLGFASAGPADAAFFRRLWAAYLAPDLNLPAEADAPGYTHYILAYGIRIDRPGVSLVRPLPGGGLYWIGRP